MAYGKSAADIAAKELERHGELQTFLTSLWKNIGDHGIMTLSTCAGDRITSRSMSVIVTGGKFYCQTDKNYLKFKQIEKNDNVALCFKNFSVEGKCRCIGTPLEDKNDFFARRFKKHFYGSYKAYSSLPSEILLEISPALIYSWSYTLTTPYMEYWDFNNKTYIKRKMVSNEK
ncbi:MAG: pyridoxamine 5'-phosphate oxidase family protein [Ruminococcus sp.]|nr:pyridoxamine 5'-phosphate oxidase family protein [Ruminococcus sp.]